VKNGSAIAETSSSTVPGPGSGKSGVEVLNNALQKQSYHISDRAVVDGTEAKALADTVFSQKIRGFTRLEAHADGDPRIRVGSHVAMSGLGSRFDNTYVVIFARHRWDLQHGYTTFFRAECAYLGN
jgi:phage protein D